MPKVNLDALIKRDDFLSSHGQLDIQSNFTISLKITELDIDSFMSKLIRKPDFQRETSEWDPEKIAELIECFINGDLIPSVILWKSPENLIFVIDGAHRLGALIAWIHDDYGDGQISKSYNDDIIDPEYKSSAEKTRKLVEQKIGSYESFKTNRSQPVDSKTRKVLNSIAINAIPIQWISGNADKAEESFFKINQKSEPLDSTERKILKSRKKPNCIGARAILRGAKGHKYWSDFTPENQAKVQLLAKESFNLLFTPTAESPIKSIEQLPLGGKTNSPFALPLTIDLVNIINDIDLSMDKDEKYKLDDDYDGTETIKYLTRVNKILKLLCSNDPSSLGLHPAIYFYSLDGRFKPTSFYSIITWIIILQNKNKLPLFIKIRSRFEKFLMDNDDQIYQSIARKHRETIKSIKPLTDLYQTVMDLMLKYEDEHDFEYFLNLTPIFIQYSMKVEYKIPDGAKHTISQKVKARVLFRDSLKLLKKCPICKGAIPDRSHSYDHVVRSRDGGISETSNINLTHPYCNTAIKN
jgi:hypothetical protein